MINPAIPRATNREGRRRHHQLMPWPSVARLAPPRVNQGLPPAQSSPRAASQTKTTPIVRAFSFSCLVGKAHHVESFAEMGIVAA